MVLSMYGGAVGYDSGSAGSGSDRARLEISTRGPSSSGVLAQADPTGPFGDGNRPEPLDGCRSVLLYRRPQSVLATPVASPDVCQTHVGVSASVTANPTNVTISWSINMQSSVSLTWGNTTNYGFTAINGVIYGAGSYKTLIDYLEPASTYYFKVLAIANPGNPFVCPGVHYGQWTTGSDSMTSFSGIVQDQNGAVFSQGDLYVEASCLNVPSGDINAPTAALTGPSGTYTGLSIPGYFVSTGVPETPCTTGPFVVQLVNIPTPYLVGLTEYYSNQWTLHWNETFVLWAVQTLNFNIGAGATTAWVPIVYQYSHTSYANVSITTSVNYVTTSSYNIAGNGVTSKAQMTEGYGFSSGWNSSDEYKEKHYVTGDTRIDMIGNRTPYIDATQWWGHEIESSNGVAGSDWTTYSSWQCTQLLQCDFWQQRGATPAYFYMSIGGSISAVSGFESSISLGFTAPVGAGVDVGPSISFDISETSTATSSGSQQVTFEVYVPSSATFDWYEFDILCEGGSSASVGLVGHVWQIGQSNTAPS